MPSLTHELFLTLFRNRPELAAELLREALGLDLPRYTEARLDSVELSQAVPTSYTADLVVLLVEARPVLGIVVEVQLARDERKRMTWPVYVTNLRARIECATELLVIAPDDAVARWAASPIQLGRKSTVTPLVLGSAGVPVVVDPARAIAAPELAVLSVMAHGKGNVSTAVEIALAATAGVKELSGEKLVLYSDLIEHALSEAARKAFEMYFPKGYEPLTETGRRLARALAEGRSEGLAEGRSEGLAEGRSEAIVAVLAARSIPLAEAYRSRLLAERDPVVLERWLKRALIAASAAELFDE